MPATLLLLLLQLTGHSGNAPIPSNGVIDWRRFFEVDGYELRNFARRLDTELIPQLHELPLGTIMSSRSIPVRNLLRGSRIGLPKAQDVAEAMGVTPLAPNEIANGTDGPILREHNFHQETPLWYYVLKEAEIQG